MAAAPGGQKPDIHTERHTMGSIHPLIARLTQEMGYPLLDAAGLAAFCEAPGDAVLFCGGNPAAYPETLDLAMVLPELMRAFPRRLRAGVAAAELEPALQAR